MHIRVTTQLKFLRVADAKYIYEKTGIKNFLIGESLLKSDNPADLIKKFKQITQ